jgi:hypothetical protein
MVIILYIFLLRIILIIFYYKNKTKKYLDYFYMKLVCYKLFYQLMFVAKILHYLRSTLLMQNTIIDEVALTQWLFQPSGFIAATPLLPVHPSGEKKSLKTLYYYIMILILYVFFLSIIHYLHRFHLNIK